MENELSVLLGKVLQDMDDPRHGLPQELFYFVSQLTPLVSVELLVKNQDRQTLLTWRHDKFHGPGWHIPGGIVRFKEHIDQRIQQVAQTEIGCAVRYGEKPIAIHSMVNKERDIRGHFISLLYLCELAGQPLSTNAAQAPTPMEGQWRWHDSAPCELIKVHEVYRKIIDDSSCI